MMCRHLSVLFLLVAAATVHGGRKKSEASGSDDFSSRNLTLRRSRASVRNITRHCPNPPEKRYELLHDFVQYMKGHADLRDLRWVLASGTLLGAMREHGFIQHDDDLDIYMPGRDLFQLYDHIQKRSSGSSPHDLPNSFSGFLSHEVVKDHIQESSSGSSPHDLPNSSSGLLLHGVLKALNPNTCCGFGYRLQHHEDECAYMDLQALSEEDKAFNGDLPPEGQKVWAIPQDTGVGRPDAMMLQRADWKETDSGEWKWSRRNAHSLFPQEYILEKELFPQQQIQMYDMTVNIPKQPKAILERTYGTGCWKHDASGDDLTAEMLKPAQVKIDGDGT